MDHISILSSLILKLYASRIPCVFFASSDGVFVGVGTISGSVSVYIAFSLQVKFA